MNKVILMGRLTRDPEVRYSQGDSQMAIARFSLAVDRRFKRQGDTVLIKKGERHRVSYTSKNPCCIWICIFFD